MDSFRDPMTSDFEPIASWVEPPRTEPALGGPQVVSRSSSSVLLPCAEAPPAAATGERLGPSSYEVVVSKGEMVYII